jgi:hypothetical protein
MRIKILKKKLIVPVVLYGCETWSLTLGEEHRLRAYENRVVRRIFGPKRDGVTGGWRQLKMISFINCTLHHILLLLYQGGWDGQGM